MENQKMALCGFYIITNVKPVNYYTASPFFVNVTTYNTYEVRRNHFTSKYQGYPTYACFSN